MLRKGCSSGGNRTERTQPVPCQAIRHRLCQINGGVTVPVPVLSGDTSSLDKKSFQCRSETSEFLEKTFVGVHGRVQNEQRCPVAEILLVLSSNKCLGSRFLNLQTTCPSFEPTRSDFDRLWFHNSGFEAPPFVPIMSFNGSSNFIEPFFILAQ